MKLGPLIILSSAALTACDTMTTEHIEACARACAPCGMASIKSDACHCRSCTVTMASPITDAGATVGVTPEGRQ